MKKILATVCCLLAAGTLLAQKPRTFTNAEGKPLTGILLEYDERRDEVDMRIGERREKIPLSKFSKEDRTYIKRWYMAKAFQSTMRFKIEINRNDWKQLKWEQNITPYWMEIVNIPGKATPIHKVSMLEDYEEISTLYLEARGYVITLKNQNMFPIDDLVVHHKIFYQQENFSFPDDISRASDNDYDDVVTTNLSKQATEIIPSIAPLEDVSLNSEYAITIDSQIERNQLQNEVEREDEDEDGEEEEAEETEPEYEDFGDFDDSSRRKKGEVIGIWVKVGIRGPEGNIIYRDITEPESLSKKVLWDFDAYLDSLPENLRTPGATAEAKDVAEPPPPEEPTTPENISTNTASTNIEEEM